MSEWFQSKVKFAKQLDNGLIKQSTELYLIDAVSFTDAETRAFKESGDNRDVQAVSIARSPIKEVVFYGDTDLWHKVKVTYSLMDEETEKEKKVTTHFLVNSADVKEAYERTEEHLKTMLVPFQIPKVELSQICEVYQYEKAAPKGYVKVERTDWPVGGPHSEEECAMEGDSVEVVVGNGAGMIHNVPKEPFVRLSADGTTIEYSNPTTEYVTNTKAVFVDIKSNPENANTGNSIIEDGATLRNVVDPEGNPFKAKDGQSFTVSIDPTEGQAVAFEMDLATYLQKIRPTITLAQIENIRDAYENGAHSLGLLSVVYGFTDDEAERIADILANESAFEADEEANETDLESRLDAAMKSN